MNKNMKRSLTLLAATALLVQGAMAESISMNGTVGVKNTAEIYAPIGGTVESVAVEVGQHVNAGDVLAELSTTKVYASQSGVITGLFGQPGDSADTIAQRYGAVMYIEGESRYTIAASTENAYNTTENKYVSVGESVYLKCYSDAEHIGTGMITAIEGTDYTVEVLTGEFLVGETVNVFRSDSYKAAERIGRGVLSRTNPTAVTGSGSIVSYAVADGDTVARGDLLFETLDGEFDGLYMSGRQILASESGVVSKVNLEQGGKVEKNSVAAVLYPDDAMRVEAEISEYDLASIEEGDAVSIELLWNQDEEVTYDGVVSMISNIATSSEGAGEENGNVTYAIYVDFTPDERTRYGMSAVVSTMDDDSKAVEEAVEDEAE